MPNSCQNSLTRLQLELDRKYPFKMTFCSLVVIIELMIIMIMVEVHGIKINENNANRTCYEIICIPHDYNPEQMPFSSNQFSVFINIQIHSGNVTRTEEGLKSIDVHKMMLT